MNTRLDRYKNIEEKVREAGRIIYSRSRTEVPSVYDKSRWTGKALEWAMKDEDFKVRLFRFIDALPSLKSDQLAVRLLREYFSDDDEFHGLLKWGIRRLPAKGLIPSIAGKVIRQNVEAFAGQFIAGKDPDDSIAVLESMRREGFAFGIDILGEVVLSEPEVQVYAQRYLDLLGKLGSLAARWPRNESIDRDDRGKIPLINVSLKTSSLYSQLDPVDWEGSIECAKENMRPILAKAREQNASITFDMEHYYIKGLTLAIFKSLCEEEEFRELPSAGIALQAYLRDSKEDLLDLIAWAKDRKRRITVRLVKGAYWDYEIAVNRQKEWPVPVFLNKEDTDHNFEDLTRILMENADYVSPAIATHSMRSISHAIAAAGALGLPPQACEFQMLYGMAEPLRRAVQEMGYRVRIYTPVGELIPGMAYLVRRLLENTSNESFLRKSFAEGAPFDELMQAPVPSGQTSSGEENRGFTNEPPLDYGKSENRDQMNNALLKTRKNFGKKYPLFIGGREVWKEELIASFNPAQPDEVVGHVSAASRDEGERAVQAAVKAFPDWRKTSVADRASCLLRAADEMRKRRHELAALEVYEVGKTWKEADGDVVEAIDYCTYYAREMTRMAPPVRLGIHPGEVNQYGYEPKGIGVVIAPWNFPFAISAGMVTAGLVTGNCVIYKPSGLSPVTGWMLFDILKGSGIPDGVLQFLPGSGKIVGEFLVSHQETDFIAFTGSKDVGLRIVALAGKTLPGQRSVKRVIAEMGGKNAIIIDETADLDDAVKGVVESAFGYQGQKCSACSRLIIVGDIYQEFTGRLKAAIASIQIGPPENPAHFMGPLIDETALGKTRKYIEMGKHSGRAMLCREMDGKGYFAGPAVFENVDPDSPLARDEIFGPVLSIIRTKDIAEALERANDSDYALTGGIYSRSPAAIHAVRTYLKAGNLYINRPITGAVVGRQPFGGFALSGVGSKAGGPDYLLQFLNPISISENTIRKGYRPPDHTA